MSPKRREPGPQTRIARLTGLVPAGRGSAARTPFVLLIVLLLGTGMLGLLLLNASLNQGSFELSELRRQSQELTDEQQALQAEVDAFSAPGALAERARDLGLVPAGPPAFLDRDGTVRGEPAPAPEPSPAGGESPTPGDEPGQPGDQDEQDEQQEQQERTEEPDPADGTTTGTAGAAGGEQDPPDPDGAPPADGATATGTGPADPDPDPDPDPDEEANP
ncbi:FtsB family cell division protein [Streptomyces carpaticus]|uniref:Septum formation initiator family protein n=1 Tax=Streptomyces carpaticus TaxID=285558 RepID=A0ABV4ZUE4_9ACTN